MLAAFKQNKICNIGRCLGLAKTWAARIVLKSVSLTALVYRQSVSVAGPARCTILCTGGLQMSLFALPIFTLCAAAAEPWYDGCSDGPEQ